MPRVKRGTVRRAKRKKLLDRAKGFYADQLGFRADMDVRTEDGRRFVRLTPPGSTCCIALGEGWIDARPGSLQGTQLVVHSQQRN